MSSMEEYSLGHSPGQGARNIGEGAREEKCAANLFRHADLRRGLYVHDIGCRARAILRIAAKIVVKNGAVLGLSKAALFLEAARSGVEALGRENVSSAESCLAEITIGRPLNVGAIQCAVTALINHIMSCITASRSTGRFPLLPIGDVA